jgi:regulator of chromosome condensation
VLGFDGVPGHSPFQFTPVPLPSLAKVKITDVSCGSDHVLALTTTGHVYVWGNGQQNQLGRRIMERRRLNGLEPERLALRNIVLVSAGMFHSFAVDKDGQVFAWGLNTFHQTGIPSSRGGDEDMINSPTRVEALSPEQHGGAKVVQIEGGEHHSIFLFDDGEVWGVGRSDANQLGLSKDHPAQEGLKERRAEAIKIKEEAVMAARKKLDEVANSEDQDVKEEAERELAGTQAAMVAALDEFVPEPVRVSDTVAVVITNEETYRLTLGRSLSRPFRRSTKSSRPSRLGQSPGRRTTPSPTSPRGRDTTSPSLAQVTSTRGVWEVSGVYRALITTRPAC